MSAPCLKATPPHTPDPSPLNLLCRAPQRRAGARPCARRALVSAPWCSFGRGSCLCGARHHSSTLPPFPFFVAAAPVLCPVGASCTLSGPRGLRGAQQGHPAAHTYPIHFLSPTPPCAPSPHWTHPLRTVARAIPHRWSICAAVRMCPSIGPRPVSWGHPPAFSRLRQQPHLREPSPPRLLRSSS